jgi:hypothetical protein
MYHPITAGKYHVLLGKSRLLIVCTVCERPLNRTSTQGVATANDLVPQLRRPCFETKKPGCR